MAPKAKINFYANRILGHLFRIFKILKSFVLRCASCVKTNIINAFFKVCETLQLEPDLITFVNIILYKFNYFCVLCTCYNTLQSSLFSGDGSCRLSEFFSLSFIKDKLTTTYKFLGLKFHSGLTLRRACRASTHFHKQTRLHTFKF